MRHSGNRSVQPPRAAEAVLERLLHQGSLGLSILGDLREDFARIRRRSSLGAARRWYWYQTISFGLRYLFVRKGVRPISNKNARVTGGEVGALFQELRYVARCLARRPGFALTVVALVAVGVGATTTIFSVVDGVLFRELPYPDPHQLVFFANPSHPAPLFKDWRDRTHSFSAVAAARGSRFDMTGDARPEGVFGASVTEGFFSMFGADAQFGRLFRGDDFVGDPARVAVLSHGFWRRKWGGNPGAMGQTIHLNGTPVEIVGILSPSFQNPETITSGRRVDMWLPVDVDSEAMDRRDRYSLRVVGQLRPGVDVRAAQADVDVLSARLAEESPDEYRRRDGTARTYPLIPLHEATTGEVDTPLRVLLGAVSLMLLIACANVANLFLARGTHRRREMALRAALGAGRSRIFYQLLTESVFLSLVGGMLGVVLAFGGVQAFGAYDPGGIPRMDAIAVDLRVLLFAVCVSVATGVLFGLVPALQAARSDVNEGLKDGSQSSTAGHGWIRLRSGLVITEIAVAMMLLVGAGLLFHSFVRLTSVDPGIDPEGLTVVPLMLPASYPEDRRIPFVEELVETVAAIPGVEMAVAGATIPMSYENGRCCYQTNIRTDPEADDAPASIVHPTTPGYFDLLGIRILWGRAFDDNDRDRSAAPAIVNETLARALFGDRDPLGRRLHFGGIDWTLVGVAEDVHHWALNRSAENNLYVPHAIFGDRFRTLHVAVASRLEATVLADGLRQAVWSIDPDLPVPEVSSLGTFISRSVAEPCFYSLLLMTFATLSILLAAGGIYGSILYSVGQRSRELGIRVALGARREQVVAMVVRGGLLMAMAGIALGLAGAYGLSRTLESFLFGVSSTDPSTFAAVAILLGGVALAAS